MHIYKEELGIAEKILANRSIACTMDIEPLTADEQVVLASVYTDTPDTADLFYIKSVFVTTNKNKNDDVFLPEEVWAAKKTPVDKLWNIDHDHSKIVGHITSSWCVNAADNKIISDDTAVEDLPSLFHLCTGGVVYKKVQDKDLQELIDDLLYEIGEGKYCTSTEAYFSDLSYVLEKGDERKVLARDETTAFLTKHLRCYGGTGEYDGYKIGRGLRNIFFGGNAFTKKPANPDSIILAATKKKEVLFVQSGVSNNKEEIIMSDNILEKQVAELKDQVKQLSAANKAISDELANASVEKYEGQIKDLREQLTASQKALVDAQEQAKSLEVAKSAVADELKGLNERYAAVAAELDETKKGAVLASRILKLTEIGLAKEEAETKAQSLVALSNEQFEDLASIIASVKPPVVPGSATAPVVPASKEAPVVQGTEVELSEEEPEVDATVASESNSDENTLMAAFAAYYDEQLSKEKK